MRSVFLIFILFLIQALALSQPCLPEGITFNTQVQVDSFPINYPNCSEIEGNVLIGGLFEEPSNIQNLDGLLGIESIGGNLIISGYYGLNLGSLSGLSNLTTIDGNLVIELVYTLNSIEGLNKLDTIGKSLTIQNTPLSDLTGLEKLVSIEEDLIIMSTQINSFSGMMSVTRIGGSITISGNSNLTDLSGLEFLTSLDGNLTIKYNQNLLSFNGLNGLQSIDSGLYVRRNMNLKNMEGFDSLTSIGGTLSIWEHETMEDFSGLENLISIGGLNINTNPRTSLKGLESLSEITGDLSIWWTGWIPDLDELANLTIVGGGIYLRNNGYLKDLNGLRNIHSNSISEVVITDNLFLSSCTIKSLCEYLSSPGSQSDIHNNAEGCNSKEEIINACDTLSLSELHLSLGLSASPNPFTASTTLTFRLSKPENVHFTVYNVQSQIVFMMQERQEKGEQQIKWEAEGLPAGMYYFRMQAGDKIGSGKMVKME